MSWMSKLPKNRKHPEKRQKQQPTENQKNNNYENIS